MAPLHATAADGAVSNVNVKASDERPLHGQLFLVLPREALRTDCAAAVGTAGRQRRLIRFVDVARRGAMPAPAVRAARFAAGPLRRRRAGAARKRRRLPGAGAPRRFEFLFQLLVLAAQPLPLGFRSPQVLAQSLDLTG